MSQGHIGPSLWHSREVNSCTRCKYLKCVLRRSGRNPDYDYFCRHPDAMAAEFHDSSALLDAAKRLRPEMVEPLKVKIAQEAAFRKEHGCFISNDSMTPETPDWCPVVVSKQTKK